MTWQNDWRRWPVGFAIGYAVVAEVGLLTKWVLETTTTITYELHWLTSMPVLALLFAYVLQRLWRAPKRPSVGSESS